jgi:RHS repeat-associated protein
MPDALGNIVGYMSSTAGMLNAEVEYSPYGRVLASAGAVSSYPFGYSGQYTDWETGLVYYGLRFYSPKHGRFVNRDPSEEAGGLNLYAFAGNGPTRGWDTLGLYDSSVNGDPVTYAYNLWVKATHDTEVTNYSPSSSVEDTDAFIWAWHGMQTRLSTPGDVIRGYAVISVVYGPDGKRTETRMDAFGNTYTYTDPNSQASNSQASNNKLPEGNVTIGHCKVLEWDCTLSEQGPNSGYDAVCNLNYSLDGGGTVDPGKYNRVIIYNPKAPYLNSQAATAEDFQQTAFATVGLDPTHTATIPAGDFASILRQFQGVPDGSVNELSVEGHNVFVDLSPVQTIGPDLPFTPQQMQQLGRYLAPGAIVTLYGCGVGQNESYLKNMSAAAGGRTVFAPLGNYPYGAGANNVYAPLQNPVKNSGFAHYP